MPSIKLLSLSAMDSRGYFPPKPGQMLNGHYQVVRLLGYGRYSSTALVNDTRQALYSYVASRTHA